MPKHLSCDDKNYIEAVCKLHKDQDLSSPYSADKEYITLVLKAFKKYEKQPNCLDMIHDKMIHYFEKMLVKLQRQLFRGIPHRLDLYGALCGILQHQVVSNQAEGVPKHCPS